MKLLGNNFLNSENYTVFKFYSAKEALTCINTTELDLAILDIMLPDIDGFTLCQKIRSKYTYPIIMLPAKDEETDKMTGLTLGADDYICKPFSINEVIARIKAVFRRMEKLNISRINLSYDFKFGDILLDLKKREMIFTNKRVIEKYGIIA